MGKKIYDSDLLYHMQKKLMNDYYDFGAYTEYNGLNVKDIRNEIIDAINKSK